MNANQFLKAVQQLQGWRECAFLLSLAERAFPNYALFAEAMELKTGAKMRQIVDAGWDLLSPDATEAAIPQWLRRLEALSPEVEDYDAYGVYPAFDFCQLLEQALLCRLNPGKHRATEASQLAIATVMSFVEVSAAEGLNDDQLVSLLDHHPLMKEDKLFQRDLVLELKRQRVPRQDFIDALRQQAENGGVSNLGISLAD